MSPLLVRIKFGANIPIFFILKKPLAAILFLYFNAI